MKLLTVADLHRLREASGRRSAAPRLLTLAAVINAVFPDLVSRLEPSSYTPIRKHRRLIMPNGRVLQGNRLAVYQRTDMAGQPIFTHNPLEPYQTNWRVVDWIIAQAATHP